MKLLASLFTLITLTLSFAQADQCAWNTKSDGRAALGFLSKGDEIVFWCQNCNEVKASVINVIDDVKIEKESNQISIKAHQKNSGAVLFKGGFYDLDLSYTYARTGGDVFTNIGHLVGCQMEGATTFLQTKGVQKIPYFYDFNGKKVIGAPEANELAGADLEKALNTGKFRAPASKK